MTLIEGAAVILKAVYMIAFLYGVVLIIEAAWNYKNSQTAESFAGIYTALLLAAGPSIVYLFFSIFSLPGGFTL